MIEHERIIEVPSLEYIHCTLYFKKSFCGLLLFFLFHLRKPVLMVFYVSCYALFIYFYCVYMLSIAVYHRESARFLYINTHIAHHLSHQITSFQMFIPSSLNQLEADAIQMCKYTMKQGPTNNIFTKASLLLLLLLCYSYLFQVFRFSLFLIVHSIVCPGFSIDLHSKCHLGHSFQAIIIKKKKKDFECENYLWKSFTSVAAAQHRWFIPFHFLLHSLSFHFSHHIRLCGKETEAE